MMICEWVRIVCPTRPWNIHVYIQVTCMFSAHAHGICTSKIMFCLHSTQRRAPLKNEYSPSPHRRGVCVSHAKQVRSSPVRKSRHHHRPSSEHARKMSALLAMFRVKDICAFLCKMFIASCVALKKKNEKLPLDAFAPVAFFQICESK